MPLTLPSPNGELFQVEVRITALRQDYNFAISEGALVSCDWLSYKMKTNFLGRAWS